MGSLLLDVFMAFALTPENGCSAETGGAAEAGATGRGWRH